MVPSRAICKVDFVMKHCRSGPHAAIIADAIGKAALPPSKLQPGSLDRQLVCTYLMQPGKAVTSGVANHRIDHDMN